MEGAFSSYSHFPLSSSVCTLSAPRKSSSTFLPPLASIPNARISHRAAGLFCFWFAYFMNLLEPNERILSAGPPGSRKKTSDNLIAEISPHRAGMGLERKQRLLLFLSFGFFFSPFRMRDCSTIVSWWGIASAVRLLRIEHGGAFADLLNEKGRNSAENEMGYVERTLGFRTRDLDDRDMRLVA